jgi:hypothetical protein
MQDVSTRKLIARMHSLNKTIRISDMVVLRSTPTLYTGKTCQLDSLIAYAHVKSNSCVLKLAIFLSQNNKPNIH